jgi:hypothetical protein
MGVPLSNEKLSILDIYSGVKFLAHPKSAILTTIPLLYCFRRTFSGFRSLCMIPFTLRAMNALTICLKMLRTSLTLNDFLLLI